MPQLKGLHYHNEVQVKIKPITNKPSAMQNSKIEVFLDMKMRSHKGINNKAGT